MAMLTRSESGVRSGCLIVSLPGSPAGVRECLEVAWRKEPNMNSAGGTHPWLVQLAGSAKDSWTGWVKSFVARFRAGRFTWAAVGLVAIALLISGCGGEFDESKVHSVMKAERFEVVDQGGNTRAVLTTLDDGRPSLVLTDTNGEFRAWLFLSADGSPNLVLIDNPRLALMDTAGELRITQSLDADGSPILGLRDKAGEVRTELRLDEGGSPALKLYNGTGDLIWSAP